MNEIEVDLNGPMFSGIARNAAVDMFLREAADDVASQLYADVMTNLNASIRNPTPYYETQVAVERNSAGGGKVHDRDIVYGPWLEGTSERNRTTSFKGYRSFGRASDAIQAKVPALVQSALTRAIARLGG